MDTGAFTNKFSTIRGKYVNMAGLYDGWFVNYSIMIGVGGSAMTNNLPVPQQCSTDPLRNLSYEYGQFGLVAKYVVNSDRPVHLAFHLLTGAGFTVQYDLYNWHNGNQNYQDVVKDENWFFVAEPGVQLEVNLFKWMQRRPGVSYRATFGSDGRGLSDRKLRNITMLL